MKTIWITLFAATLGLSIAGCGDDGGDPNSPTCSPAGTYTMEFASRSNTCGELIDVNGITSLRQEISFTEGKCGTQSTTVPAGDPPQGCTYTATLAIDATPNGPENGELTYNLSCGEDSCAAVFRVDFTEVK